MVTIELAVGILVIIVVTASLVSMAMLGVAQAACVESASQLARQTARADETAVKDAKERAPKGAKMTIVRGQDGVEATVHLDVAVLGIGSVTVMGEAWAAYEPGVSQ